MRRPFDGARAAARGRASSSARHIDLADGRVTTVAALCARARAARALSIVDGAHAPGQIALDLEALGADFYAGNCHKWLCAPKGVGVPLRAPEAQPLIDPLVISWDWADGAAFHELHRWQGTRDPSAYLAVPAAIAFQAEHDWPACATAAMRSSTRADELALDPLTDDFVQMLGFRAAGGGRRRVEARPVRRATGSRCPSSRRGTAGRCAVDPGLQRRGRPRRAAAALSER